MRWVDEAAHVTLRERFVTIALVDFWWGFVVWLPPVNQFAHSPLYSHMADLGGRNVWGPLFMVIGVALFVTSVFRLDGWYRPAVMLSAVAWMYVLFAYLLALPSSTAIPVTFYLIVSHGWAYMRLTPRRNHDVDVSG